MKRLSLKSLTFALALIMAMTLLALRQNVLARKKSAPRILLAAILPLSSSPRGSRMIAKGIMCLALVAACASCKSHKYGLDALRAVQDSVALYSVVHSVDTVVVRDSVIRHDSVIYRERTIHDTVYITKEVYRNANAHNSSLIVRNSTDTVVVTEWREKVIEPPPERYIPPFYKHCTTILFIILAAGIVWIVGRWYIKFRL